MDAYLRQTIMINKISKYIPPYFPDSEFLKKKWWHRFAWILSVIVSSCSFYSVILSTIALFLINSLWSLPFFPMLYLPMYIPTFFISLLTQSNILPVINDSNLSSILFIFLLLGTAFIPTLLYRLILFIAFGKSWKNR